MRSENFKFIKKRKEIHLILGLMRAANIYCERYG